MVYNVSYWFLGSLIKLKLSLGSMCLRLPNCA